MRTENPPLIRLEDYVQLDYLIDTSISIFASHRKRRALSRGSWFVPAKTPLPIRRWCSDGDGLVLKSIALNAIVLAEDTYVATPIG